MMSDLRKRDPWNLKAFANPKTLVILALLSALSIILEKFLGISSSAFKLHFGYLPIALAGMLYGIIPAGFVALVADALSNLENFNLLFSLLALMEGAVYGAFLYTNQTDRKKLVIRAVLCQLVISLVIHAGLNTLLLWKLYGLFLPIRFLTQVLIYPIKVYSIYLMMQYRSVFEKYA